ncbi:hypothetical protein JCM10212_004645 [Sporobolomyces blumeae]
MRPVSIEASAAPRPSSRPRPASRQPRPSDPTPLAASPSTPSFPLFSRIVSLSFSSTPATTSKPRERRISLGGFGTRSETKKKSHADSTDAASTSRGPQGPSSTAADLKRSKSTRNSWIGIATRQLPSTLATRPTSETRPRRGSVKEFPSISRPVMQNRPDDSDPGAFMADYRERSILFASSSPELVRRDGTLDEAAVYSREPQWAAWAVPSERPSEHGAAEGQETPTSPMVKWRGKGASSSFEPLASDPPAPSQSRRPQSQRDSTAPRRPVGPTSTARDASPALPHLACLSGSSDDIVDRSSSTSLPLDEAIRTLNREQALAKLTSPTPTNSKFPDSDLDAFPFPRVPTPNSDQPVRVPARPSRPPPPLPGSTGAQSLIVTSPTTPLSPPPLTRSNTVSLHPSPSVALDIDFRGRLVRARNSHTTPAGPGPTTSLTSSPSIASSSSNVTSVSPPSSRFTDWSSRRSSGTSIDSSNRPSTADKDDPNHASSASFYGISDRRHAESAVDVLAIVEEDELPVSIPTRSASRRVSAKRTDPKSSVSPQRRVVASSKRLSLEGTLSTPSARPGQDVLVIPRQRARHVVNPELATPARPLRLSESNRSISSGLVSEPTRAEKEEFGSRFSIETGARPLHRAGKVNFVDSPPPRGGGANSEDAIPFPAASAASPTARALSPPRRPHRRAISDLHVDHSLSPLSSSPSSSPPLDGLGIGLGLPPPIRSRHESFAPESEETGEALLARRASRRASGLATRTKLVLREKGKPTLTYQLGECIGRGQFGTVYRALNLNTGEVVAVKRIQLEGKTEAEIEQLSNEVALLQRLIHPAIVRYQGLLRSENYLNIVLEYAESGSLQTTLRQFGQLPEGLVASYVVKILEGLAYLHEQGVVHCDLKAANILSTKTGNVKLSDFGVSLNLHAIKNTQGFGGLSKDVQGTPNWMAPEIIEMKGALPASDIWSLGCTVCELIDGRPPYADLVAMSAMFRIVEDENGPPIPEQCSSGLRAFLARCFKKEPSERPTAEQLFADPWLLEHFDARQDLRSQDSLPFLRRISGDCQRPRPALDMPSPLSMSLANLSSAIDDGDALLEPSPPFASIAPAKRDSIDSGYIASEEMPGSPETSTFIHATEETPQLHDWIRSSFSRAVDCKLCGEQTKRHAVLCSRCGLVSHRRCTEFAPACDLRAQLLGNVKHPLFPAATISSVSPPTTGFSFADYLPGFGKARRPRPTPTSSDQSVNPVSPSAPTTKTSSAIRHLSNMLPTKTRTPEHTPPSSLTRTNGGVLSRARSSTTVASGDRRNVNGSGSSIVHVDADDLLGSAPNGASEGPLRRKLSNNIVVQSAMSARLGKRKSHSRTQSQPVNKPKANEGDCIVM